MRFGLGLSPYELYRDFDGADKAARFMQLLDAFDIPLVVLCDTPGIMVGPEVETAEIESLALSRFPGARWLVTADDVGAGVLRLNRPAAINALTVAMMRGMREALDLRVPIVLLDNMDLPTLREAVAPDAGLILCHHTKKLQKRQLVEDPFMALSGASALRSFYTSGMIMFRPDEERPERRLEIELRNGPALDALLVDKRDGRWVEISAQGERLVRQSVGQRLDALDLLFRP